MAEIVFFKTRNLKKTSTFYLQKLGFSLWLDQKKCMILKRENLLLGFCENTNAETNSCITFFFKTKAEVDDMHKMFSFISDGEPRYNEEFKIYQFFAKDPEGRILEFQWFDHAVSWEF